MQRLKYHIKNSRIWHLATLEIATNTKITLDNWTRYRGPYKEIYYINDKTKFLEIDHYNQTFHFLSDVIRQSNKEDFRNFYSDYMGYREI